MKLAGRLPRRARSVSRQADAVEPDRQSRLACLPAAAARPASVLARAGIVVYGLLFILYLAARFMIGERSHLVALANSLLPWLCWVGMGLGVLSLIFRDRWRLVALQVPAAVTFGLAYGALFWPAGAQPVPRGPALTAVMYNVCG